MKYIWHNLQTITSQSYTCGHCGKPLASEKGYYANDVYGNKAGSIQICHHCTKPTFITNTEQIPGTRFGHDVDGIEDNSVSELYDEARDCFSINAFTSCVLSCRKLLMHIAVSKGADMNKKFIEYVEYLSNKGYVPPDAKDWVDHIRTKGNEASHEIVVMKSEEAMDILSFTEMLLKLVYEFPTKSKKFSTKVNIDDTQKQIDLTPTS